MQNKYLWDGLNLDRFAVIAIWPQSKEEVVILMRSRWPDDDPAPWCVQYRGNGHYFASAHEALEYCAGRKFKSEAYL